MNKRCYRCETEKPLEAFHKSSRNKDGRQSACKECFRLRHRLPSSVPPPTGVQISQIRSDVFWSRVEKTDDCWIWKGGRNDLNYGVFHNWKVHRLSYFWLVGDVPDELDVCHHCDNPPCLRPDHLFLGDQAANNADMFRKGRAKTIGLPGELNPQYKHILTADTVKAILSNPPSGHGSIAKLARELGISDGHLGSILKRRKWKHIPVATNH